MLNLIKSLRKFSPVGRSVESQTDTEQVVSAQEQEESAITRNDETDLGLFDAFLSGWYQNATNEVFRGISIGSNDVVVDVGCGSGGSSLFCAKRGARVIAFDIDPQVVATINDRLKGEAPGGFEAHVSDANPLPLADNTASRVLCTEVLEHVDDPDQVLRELYRVGRPGALYLLTVPDALQEHLQQRVAHPSYFQKPNHIRIIERTDFAAMVERAGLIIEEQTQYGFFWSIWWALFWPCKVHLAKPDHPVLNHWTEAWRALLSTPEGQEHKRQLDAFMPKSQVIVARKP